MVENKVEPDGNPPSENTTNKNHNVMNPNTNGGYTGDMEVENGRKNTEERLNNSVSKILYTFHFLALLCKRHPMIEELCF